MSIPQRYRKTAQKTVNEIPCVVSGDFMTLGDHIEEFNSLFNRINANFIEVGFSFARIQKIGKTAQAKTKIMNRVISTH